MSDELASLIVDLQLESVSLREGLDKATEKLKKFEESTKRAKETIVDAEVVGSKWGNWLKTELVGSMTAASLASDVLKGALSAVRETLQTALHNAMEAERADIRLANQLQVLGYGARDLLGPLKELADNMQFLTGVEGETIQEMEGLYLTAGVAPSQMEPLIKATLNYAALTGKDAVMATRELIGVLNGQSNTLGKLKFEIGDTTTKGQRLEAILRELAGTTGLAETNLKGWDGLLRGLKTNWNELLETVGTFILKVAELPALFRSLGVPLAGLKDDLGLLGRVLELINTVNISKDGINIGGGSGVGLTGEGERSSTGKRLYHMDEWNNGPFDLSGAKAAVEKQRKAEEALAKEKHDLLIATFKANKEYLEEEQKAREKEAKLFGDIASESMSMWENIDMADLAKLAADTLVVIKTDIDTFADKLGEVLQDAGTHILQAAVSKSQYLGNVLRGAVQGFKSTGDIWGAIIGALGSLLSETKGFGRIIGLIDDAFGMVIGALEPLFTPLEKLSDLTNRTLAPLMDALGAFLESLMVIVDLFQGPLYFVMEGVIKAVTGISVSLMYVVRGSLLVFEWIVTALWKLAGAIDEKLAGWINENVLTPLTRAGYSIQEKIDKNVATMVGDKSGVSKTIDDGLKPVKVAGEDAAEALNKFSEALTNAPTGFRVSQYRYAAQQYGKVQWGGPEQNINVYVGNEQVAAVIESMGRRRRLRINGSPA